MNSQDVLKIIAGGLTYQDLLSFAQVNRFFNSVSKKPELWQKECARVFFGCLDLFG